MDFQFYFKKMTSSEALKQVAVKKISERIEKYANPTQIVHVTFLQDGLNNTLHCSISTRSGTRVYAESTSENMYNAIDLVAHKLEAQFERQKSKKKNHHKRKFNPIKAAFFRPSLQKTRVNDQPIALEYENEFIDADDIVKWEAAQAHSSNVQNLRMQIAH